MTTPLDKIKKHAAEQKRKATTVNQQWADEHGYMYGDETKKPLLEKGYKNAKVVTTKKIKKAKFVAEEAEEVEDEETPEPDPEEEIGESTEDPIEEDPV